MSGICAVWRRDGAETVETTIASMGSGLALATAEHFRSEAAENAGVAVSARFQSQQVCRTARLLVACDAELYNQDELLGLLSGDARSQAVGSVAALLSGLYERFGCAFVERLNGAFSMVLWDRQERRMLAAVDAFGIKRLVYYEDGGVFLAASRLEALTRSGAFETDVNPRAIANILNFTCNLAPETIFAKVKRLSPGSIATVSAGGSKVRKYWDMQYGVSSDADENRLSRRLEAVVEQAVATHCNTGSFAQTGAFLSGGTDSSTVVGMMARQQKGRAKAFSIGFEEQRFNELEYAELAAKKFDADHYKFLVGPRDCFDALPEMIRYFDEPFANSSAIPTYFCARLAAQNGVSVLLAGDGGDELFGGNERYRTDKIFEIYQNVPWVLRKGALEPLLRALPFQRGPVAMARSYTRRSNLPRIERYFSYNFLCAHDAHEIFAPDFDKSLGSSSVLEIPAIYYAQAPARDHLDRLLYVDVKITLGDSDLPKVTCMSELAGIQTRFPFLDRRVAEFSGHIPARLKVKGFKKRYLFKKAFRDLLPVEIIRKQKHGFGIPVATWLKSDRRMSEMARDTLLSARSIQRGYFRRSFVENLFRKHASDDSTYYGDTLWTFLVLELWHLQYVDQPVSITACK